MIVNGVVISEKSLTNFDLIDYAHKLHIPNFRGVFMRDNLPRRRRKENECGIMNLNTSSQKGSHWVTWYVSDNTRIYFDSFGQHVPYEVVRYLKTPKEYRGKTLCIERNALIVQHINTSECGALCLVVLKRLSSHIPYGTIIQTLHKRYLNNVC